MAKETNLKTYITKIQLIVNDGMLTILDEFGKQITPIPVKMDQYGSMFADISILLCAVGFKVVSTRDIPNDNGSTVEVEVLINKDLSPNQVKLYMNSIVNPCIAQYFIDGMLAAIKANNTVEEIADNPNLDQAAEMLGNVV